MKISTVLGFVAIGTVIAWFRYAPKGKSARRKIAHKTGSLYKSLKRKGEELLPGNEASEVHEISVS